MSKIEKILAEALVLDAIEKLKLIDNILASLQPVNKGVEGVWSHESQERVSSYKNGSLPEIDEETTFAKYKS